MLVVELYNRTETTRPLRFNQLLLRELSSKATIRLFQYTSANCGLGREKDIAALHTRTDRGLLQKSV
jgi:hypothetical protein